MRPKKTPTSSLSGSCTTLPSPLLLPMIAAVVIELITKRVWYRSLARIQRMRSGSASPETSVIHASPATRLPQEIVGIIIAYLTYDMRSLRACTMTCYSWYIAAAPYLHYGLTTTVDPRGRKFRYPNPLQHMHTLGLLPLIKQFRVRGCDYNCVGLSPKSFNLSTLGPFFALTNVQRLNIDYLDIPSFMPRIRRYFRHFLPTVRSLALKEPKGSNRQIIYFVGLFQHLEDLELLHGKVYCQGRPADDPTLIPPFAPPLRGRLTMTCFTRVGFLKDMITLFGGISFRSMDLCNVRGMRVLLDACAKTLRTLRLYPTDPRGKKIYLKGVRTLANDFAAKSSPHDFDLSRNQSLRTLEVTTRSIDDASSGDSPGVASKFLKRVISTITTSGRFNLIVFYREHDFRGVQPVMSQAERLEEASRHRRRFEIFREAHKVLDFRLVLCANVWNYVEEYSVRVLEEILAEEKEKRGFDGFHYEPSVAYRPRRYYQ